MLNNFNGLIFSSITWGGKLKKYIARREVEQKYQISYSKLVDYEEKGLLTAYSADKVRYSRKGNRGGARVKWVYDEEHIAALFRKVGPDARLVKRSRKEAEVLEMLEKGIDLVVIVRQLKLLPAKAEQIRDFYLREKGAVVVPGYVCQALHALGFSLTTENAAEVFMGLVDRIRELEARLGKKDKPPPKHVRLIPKKKR